MGEKEPYIPVTAQAVNKPENISLPDHQDAPVKPGYMRLVDGLKTRVVAGQIVLMPTGDAVSKVRQSAVLNHEAARLVERIVNTLCLAGMLEGDEVKERLKGATTSISGTAVVQNGKVLSSKITGIKKMFGIKANEVK